MRRNTRDQDFRPELNLSGQIRNVFLELGIKVPTMPHRKIKAVQVNGPVEGLHTAVWPIDLQVHRSEYPALALAIAKDREDTEIRKIESYYLGFVAREAVLGADQSNLPNLLLEHAENRLNHDTGVIVNVKGHVQCDSISKSTLPDNFPEDPFLELIGASKTLSKFELQIHN
jgi:hypothetical protein